MIRLTKLAIPQVLADNAAAWTNIILTKLAQGLTPSATEKTRYRHRDVKATLVEETHGKCAYCESKLLHIHHGDVEHIVPKSLEPALTHDWNNLTLACEVCNQNKSDRDPRSENIIDPYNVEPADHVIFNGPLVVATGTPHGLSTRALLDLNRSELVERRKEQLEKICTIYETIFRTDIPLAVRKAVYHNMVATECAAKAQFSAMANSTRRQLDSLLPETITA